MGQAHRLGLNLLGLRCLQDIQVGVGQEPRGEARDVT